MNGHDQNGLMSKFSDRLRLVLLLDACEAADMAPIPIARVHALAFLANVLSPIWSVASYEGKILKRKDGPFYPELQAELDCLVGLGIAKITNIDHKHIDGRWQLEGSFALREPAARPILELAQVFFDERKVSAFLRRLVFGTAVLHRPLEHVISFDATWSDLRTGVGDVIDFSEWKSANYSAFTADYMEKALAPGALATRGDKLHLYMRLLDRRAVNAE